MEYNDELERMRARKNRERIRRNEPKQEPEINIIDFDELDYTALDEEPARRRKVSGRERNSGRKAAGHHASGRSAKEQRLRKRKKKRRILLAELLVLAVLVGGLFFYFKNKVLEGYWTIAIFGLDSRDGSVEKGALSDVEMLCVIDRKTGEMKLVSVYRDTYLQIDEDGTFHKINEAYLKGGHKQAVSALERNLDLKIDDYVTFNWKAVADTINILGGIDLEITDSEFKYINGFITETVNSTGIGSVHLQHAGMNHLDGVQAVAYARLRLMDTDYNRTARQRKVIMLAMEKAKTADFSVLNNILTTVLPQTSTSLGIDDLIPIAKNLGKYHLGTTDGFPFSRGETKISRRDCVVPLTLESNVVQLHALLYGVEDYKPSSTVKKISAQIASDSGMGEVADNAPTATAGGSGGGQPSTQAPPQTQEPETSPEETDTTEETTEETSSEEETSLEESLEEQGPGVVGPGGSQTEENDTTDRPEPSTDIEDGPGVSDGPGSIPTEEPDGPEPAPGVTPGSTEGSGGPGDIS